MSNKVIMIDNNYFSKDKNVFSSIGTEGFTLLTYLLYQQANNDTVGLSIKMIQSFLNRDYDKRPNIRYNKTKKCKVSCMKEKDTITQYLQTLIRNKLIKIHNYDDLKNKYLEKMDILAEEFNLSKVNINEILIIECIRSKYENGFFPMPNDLFLNYVHKIGHIGWSLFCLLSKLHNASFGNIEDGGFASPTEEYMGHIIERGISSVKVYLCLLEEMKLIKTESQEPVIVLNKLGLEEFKYMPNHYKVRWKLPGDKSYFDLTEVFNKIS